MTTIFLSQFWVQRLGWTLLHFLWQGTAIAAVDAVLRSLLGRSLSARGRYVLACAALFTMAVAPLLTFLLIPEAYGSGRWTISALEWQRLLPAIVALWLLGVLIFSIRLVGGWRFTARLRSTSHPAPSEWQQTLQRIAARIGTSPRVRLRVSSMVDVPTVMGWLRPVILVPVAFLTGLSFDHITALMAHELAHVRRQDYLASILQNITETALFYHPAVWWISDQIRAEREACCDDLAVAATGDVLAYARALAELESRQPVRLTPVLAANGGSLVNRVRRLIEPGNGVGSSLPGPGTAWAMTFLWLVGVGVAAVHSAQTQASRVADLVSISFPEPSPPAALAGRVRNTLLFDPVLPVRPVKLRSRPNPTEGSGVGVDRDNAVAHEEKPEQRSSQAPDIKINDPEMVLANNGLPLPVMKVQRPAPLPSSEEPPPAPIFRAATKLVQVDVIARTKRAPASGLTKEDFTLFDNGKPRQIALFVVASSRMHGPHSVPLPAGSVSNRLEGDGDSLANATVLLIDRRNTAQTDQAFSIQRIVKFLRTRNTESQPDRIGIYVFGRDSSLQVVQEITDDTELLSRAADKVVAGDPSYRNRDTTGMTARAAEEHTVLEVRERAMDTKHVLEAIARHLASVPGRKGLIWVTSPPLGLSLSDRSSGMEEAARALNDADVALYAVDARGLVGALSGTTTLSNAESGGLRSPAPFVPQTPAATGLLSGIDTLSRLAELTGGLTLYNTNGIEDSIRKALDDAQLTYTLGFYPEPEEQEGVWHQIAVKVSRPGVTMNYRKKYFASGPLVAAKDRPSLPDLLNGPLDATQLQLVAETVPDRTHPDFRWVSVSVDLHHVHLENHNNTWMGALDVSLSMEGSRTARTIARKIEIPNDDLADALNQGIVFKDSIGLDRAASELRIVAQDRATGAAGSVRIPLSNR